MRSARAASSSAVQTGVLAGADGEARATDVELAVQAICHHARHVADDSRRPLKRRRDALSRCGQPRLKRTFTASAQEFLQAPADAVARDLWIDFHAGEDAGPQDVETIQVSKRLLRSGQQH